MSDPLSISVSILAIIGAVKSSVKAAKSFYNAPDEIDSFLNDLTEADLMIRDIQSSLAHSDPFDGPQTELESAFGDKLKATKDVLSGLQNLVENEFKLSSPNSRPTKRLVSLRLLHKAKKLRKKLIEAHSELPRRLGQLQDHRIRLELSGVSFVQDQLQTKMSRLESQAVSAIQHLAHIHRIQEEQNRTQADMNSAFQILPRMLSSLELRRSSISLVSNVSSTPSSENLHSPSPFQIPTRPFTYESIIIKGQYYTSKSCHISCRCKCHLEQKAVSPSNIISLLGQLFIGYKALPGLRVSCTDPLCKKDKNTAIKISYYFPQWWVRQRVMKFEANYHASRGPEIALSFPRIVPINSYIFAFTYIGHLESIKNLFNSGLASPNDIRGSKLGETVLQSALICQNWNLVPFMISHGASLETRDNTGRNALDYAWTIILSKSVSLEIADWLSVLFPYPGSAEFGFSNLHKAILNIGLKSPKEEISRLTLITETINDQDFFGRTPLSWAVGRGDIKTTELLLQHGADPNIRDKLGWVAVTHSIMSGKCKCIPLLFHYGANLDSTDNMGETTLYHLAENIRGPLFKQTADLLDPLSIDVNAKSNNGFSILFAAVASNNCEGVRWLLAHHANYKDYFATGTILQFLGLRGTSEMIEIVREARLVGIDIHHTGAICTRSALDMLTHPSRKTPASPEMTKIFTLLVNEIEERNIAESLIKQPLDKHQSSKDPPDYSECEIDFEEFADAVEELES